MDGQRLRGALRYGLHLPFSGLFGNFCRGDFIIAFLEGIKLANVYQFCAVLAKNSFSGAMLNLGDVCPKEMCLIHFNTVTGRNPAPVDMENIPFLFIFHRVS